MFGTTHIPSTTGDHDWRVPQAPASAPEPLAQLLAEMRQTNALLGAILAALPGGNQESAYKSDALVLAERVEWLERQVAEIKGRP